jgi:hypothetical protein
MDDLRISVRQLLKTPGFTVAAIGVLALGIGLNSAMFTVVHALAFAARPFPRPEQLVQLYSRDSRTSDYRAFSYPVYQEVARSDAFSGVVAFNPTIVGIGEGAESRRTFSMVVSANYFDVLGAPLFQGRGFTADESRPGQDTPVVIATYAYWKRTGSDPAALGKTIRINERPFTIVGITPPGFTGTMTVFGPELFFPLGVFDSLANDFQGETTRTLGRADGYHLYVEGGRHSIYGFGYDCPDKYITDFMVDGAVPSKREIVCEDWGTDVTRAYQPLIPTNAGDYADILETFNTIDNEIQLQPEYFYSSFSEDVSVACPFGGSFTFGPSDAGEAYTFENCSYVKDFALTGSGSNDYDKGIITFETQVSGKKEGDLVYTDKTEDLHLSRTEKGFVLYVLGKSGEVRPDTPVNLALAHNHFTFEMNFTLQTDAKGRIELGPLDEITGIRASIPSGVRLGSSHEGCALRSAVKALRRSRKSSSNFHCRRSFSLNLGASSATWPVQQRVRKSTSDNHVTG